MALPGHLSFAAAIHLLVNNCTQAVAKRNIQIHKYINAQMHEYTLYASSSQAAEEQ